MDGGLQRIASPVGAQPLPVHFREAGLRTGEGKQVLPAGRHSRDCQFLRPARLHFHRSGRGRRELRGKLRFCRAGHRDGTEPRRRSGGHQGSGQLQFLRRAEPGSGLPQQGTFPCDGQFPDGADRPERPGVHHGTQERRLGRRGRGHGHQLPVPQAGEEGQYCH